MAYKLIFVSLFLILSSLVSAQSFKISGKVIDVANKLAIPSVACCNDTICSTTDYNGHFVLESKQPITKILFIHRDYVPVVYAVTPDTLINGMVVSLSHIYIPDSTKARRYFRTPVDSATLHIVDSLNRAESLAHDLRVMEALISGYIHIYFLSIDYRKIINYDQYEGIRPGLGLYTNKLVSSYFSLGGYFSYGFKDKDWKYGSSLQLFPTWQSDTKLILKYKNDVDEIGGYTFLDENKVNQSEFFRNLLINQMVRTEESEIDLSYKPLEAIKINLFLNQAEKKISHYIFNPLPQNANGQFSEFDITEVGVNFKFSFKEDLIRTPGGRILSLGTKYPIIWLNFKKGINFLSGQFLYSKYELKLSQSLISQGFGKTELVFVGGLVKGSVPVCNLYNGHASYDKFFFDVENSFTTMRVNEFKTSEFVSFFMRQDFGNVFIRKPFFHPELAFVTNLGYGKLNNSMDHQSGTYIDYRKGFVESGILIGKLLDQNGLISYGFGIYYRYGAYGFKRIAENFGYKLTVNFKLRR